MAMDFEPNEYVIFINSGKLVPTKIKPPTAYVLSLPVLLFFNQIGPWLDFGQFCNSGEFIDHQLRHASMQLQEQ